MIVKKKQKSIWFVMPFRPLIESQVIGRVTTYETFGLEVIPRPLDRLETCSLLTSITLSTNKASGMEMSLWLEVSALRWNVALLFCYFHSYFIVISYSPHILNHSTPHLYLSIFLRIAQFVLCTLV